MTQFLFNALFNGPLKTHHNKLKITKDVKSYYYVIFRIGDGDEFDRSKQWSSDF